MHTVCLDGELDPGGGVSRTGAQGAAGHERDVLEDHVGGQVGLLEAEHDRAAEQRRAATDCVDPRVARWVPEVGVWE